MDDPLWEAARHSEQQQTTNYNKTLTFGLSLLLAFVGSLGTAKGQVGRILSTPYIYVPAFRPYAYRP